MLSDPQDSTTWPEDGHGSQDENDPEKNSKAHEELAGDMEDEDEEEFNRLDEDDDDEEEEEEEGDAQKPKRRGPKKKKMTKARVQRFKMRRMKANARERNRMHGLKIGRASCRERV